MNSIKIPYQQTGYFSNIIVDYLNQKQTLKPFYNYPFQIESFEKLIKERTEKPINRKVLVEALENQYKGVEATSKTLKNIQSLNNNNCFTVTTGHQLNLFTGPLYFIYKIISAINLAKELKLVYPKNDFVPVYWMATEDHDFDEVNHFNLFGNKIALEKTQEGAVGRMKLTGIEVVFNQLTELLGNRPEAEKIISFFNKYYTANSTFTQATQRFVNALFGEYGLVIIDGDDRRLKQQMVVEFQRELINQDNFKTINITSEQLSGNGYKTQISPREINLFYLQDNSRERIVIENDTYKVLNTTTSFSKQEILTELEIFPERFSPNVALRPLYQEKILPNLAYVGGGGELAYWFQLKEMFNSNQISFPVLVLRNSALLLDAVSKKKLDKIGISVTQLFGDTNTFIKEFLKEGSSIVLDLKDEEQQITRIFDEMVHKAEAIDITLKPMISAELQKLIKTIQNIEARLIKAEKQKEEVTVNQIKNVKEKLFPNGSLQERYDNLILLYLLGGFGIVDILIECLNPFELEVKVIEF
ncbi:MAG: bacillithiol biosynthesis cysteine-adding enzyme BshC [Flavobacteriales bacterium]